MIHVLNFFNELLFLYYACSNVIYLALLITAAVTTARHQARLAEMRIDPLQDSPFTPPVTIVCPARNEEAGIVDSVRALLDLRYPNIEVVVVNDGSTDATFERLQSAFDLRPVHVLYLPQVKSAPVKGLHVSRSNPQLIVVDKINAGSKADAINAGINVATSPYLCVVDADSILEPDALFRIMSPVFTDDHNVVAIGGIIRILNGSEIGNGRVTVVKLPRKSLEILQVVEYFRAFLVGREAWAAFKMLPIISGAFGVFRTDEVRRIGGFRSDAIGEDLDLVVRMQRQLLERNQQYRVLFVPDPTCWTEAPSDLGSLGRQRSRWQKGLLDVLWRNRDMLLRPKYGAMGLLMLPYLWIFELCEPVIEFLGYASIATAGIFGMLNRVFLLKFLLFGYAFATMISVGAIMLEEHTFRRYSKSSEVAKLLIHCFLEHFPYRQIHMIWRLQGMWQYIRGDVAWGDMRRRGFVFPVKPSQAGYSACTGNPLPLAPSVSQPSER